jgi:hypothetical protein
MIDEKVKERVERATVKFLRQGGQGVLVKGDYIITAAHCINYTLSGDIVVGEYFIEEIQTVEGILKISPYVIEPITDIAALSAPDDQALPEEALTYERFCRVVSPLPLFTGKLKWQQKMPVYVFTHKGIWSEGEVTRWASHKDAPGLALNMREQIEGGTSGSPIVNERGQLIAIVSNASTGAMRSGSACEGSAFRPHLALPVWIVREIGRGGKQFEKIEAKT